MINSMALFVHTLRCIFLWNGISDLLAFTMVMECLELKESQNLMQYTHQVCHFFGIYFYVSHVLSVVFVSSSNFVTIIRFGISCIHGHVCDIEVKVFRCLRNVVINSMQLKQTMILQYSWGLYHAINIYLMHHSSKCKIISCIIVLGPYLYCKSDLGIE